MTKKLKKQRTNQDLIPFKDIPADNFESFKIVKSFKKLS